MKILGFNESYAFNLLMKVMFNASFALNESYGLNLLMKVMFNESSGFC
jgi:hypothetical protein